MRDSIVSLAALLCACAPSVGESDESDDTMASTESPATETDTDPSTDSGEVVCAEPDPSVDASWMVDVGDWPFDADNSLTIDAPCTIAAITVGEAIDLELACDHDGTARMVTMSAAATAEGAPAFGLGLAVSLHYRFYEEWDLTDRIVQRVALRDAESGALLLAAADTGKAEPGELNPFGPDVAPMGLAEELLLECGSSSSYELPTELTFSLGDETLALQAGQRGVLAIADATEVYAIDLATAEGWGPDAFGDGIEGHIELVVRRVTPG